MLPEGQLHLAVFTVGTSGHVKGLMAFGRTTGLRYFHCGHWLQIPTSVRLCSCTQSHALYVNISAISTTSINHRDNNQISSSSSTELLLTVMNLGQQSAVSRDVFI